MKLSEALKVEDGEVKPKYDWKKIFEAAIGLNMPTKSELDLELERMIRIFTAHHDGSKRLGKEEYEEFFEDFRAIAGRWIEVLDEDSHRTTFGYCFECAGYGQLFELRCFKCR